MMELENLQSAVRAWRSREGTLAETDFRKPALRVLLFASLFTISLSPELSAATATGFCANAQFGSTMQLSGIAALGTAMLVALVYLFGESFASARMLTWAKGEALQVFVSLAIVGALLWFLSIFCQIQVGEMDKLLGISNLPEIYQDLHSTANMYDSAILYLENIAGASLANLASLRYNLGAYEIRTSFNKYICDAICLFSLSSTNEATFGGETMSLAITNNLLSVGTIAYLSAIFQYFTLQYIANGLFMVFLPIAIVMRSIPFMRQFGGALIAIIASLYLFYPLMLVMDGFVAPGMAQAAGPIVLVDHTGKGCGTDHSGSNLGLGAFGGGVTCTQGTSEDALSEQAGVSESSVEGLLATSNGRVVAPYDPGTSIRMNVLIFLSAVFLPAINFVVIAALARDLSHFLGEETDISRLGQMV